MRAFATRTLLTGLMAVNLLALPPGAPATSDAMPPMPHRPSVVGMTPDEAQKTMDVWRDAYSRWQRQLTSVESAKRFEDLRTQMKRDGRLPERSDHYDWKGTATARLGFTPAEVAQLERSKLLIRDIEYRQCFEAYQRPRVPMFITTDSLLNAYCALFEDSFHRLEQRQSIVLRQKLEEILDRARRFVAGRGDSPELLTAGWKQAQRAIGPAMILLGTPLQKFDPEVRDDVAAEVDKIKAAQVLSLPAWLGPPTPDFEAIDYREFKPNGFYADSPSLSDYFRAIRWLQTVPFRVERDNELSALLVLARDKDSDQYPDYWRELEGFLGPPSGNSLMRADWIENGYNRENWSELVSQKKAFLEFRNRPAKAQGDVRARTAETEPYRFLAPYELPDSVMYQELADARTPVNGNQLAAMLSSNWAQSHDGLRGDPVESKAIADGRKALAERGKNSRKPVYSQYLQVLETLFAPPDSDAPEFMRSDAWAAKSCQTALAGWVEMRHPFALQAKVAVYTFGLSLLPPGFFEPNPDFYEKFVALVTDTEDRLRDWDVFSDVDASGQLAEPSQAEFPHPTLEARWLALERIARQSEEIAQKQLRRRDLDPEEISFIKDYGFKIANVMGYFGDGGTPRDDVPKWVPIASDPATKDFFGAAIGRPRAIYVLYPGNGMEILCAGAVIPYYDDHTNVILTDAEWRQRLDGKDRPQLPVWVGAALGRP